MNEISKDGTLSVEAIFCRVRPEDDQDMALPTYHSELAAGMDVAAAVVGAR